MRNYYETRCEKVIVVLVMALTACTVPHQQEQVRRQDQEKIMFPLNNIRGEGLRGAADGLVSVAYEFCVPADEWVFQEVRRIDSSVQIHPGSRGRIGCAKDQALCIGSTHQSRWREVLKELSSMSYINEIRESHYE